VSARRLLGIACIVTFWCSGRFLGESYPFSPLGMFQASATTASRLFVRDSSGAAREIGHYEAWSCERALDFESALPASCPKPGFSAYAAIVRDHIESHPAMPGDTERREPLEITRRIFRIPDPVGPVEVTDCPLLSCSAREIRTALWIPRL
jgi:hypothetical protein